MGKGVELVEVGEGTESEPESGMRGTGGDTSESRGRASVAQFSTFSVASESESEL